MLCRVCRGAALILPAVRNNPPLRSSAFSDIDRAQRDRQFLLGCSSKRVGHANEETKSNAAAAPPRSLLITEISSSA
jgi:hypothetical protein